MAKGQNAKKPKLDIDSSDNQVKQFMPSQRYPASCPGCGTNSRISIATHGPQAGNKLDCSNCGSTYTWQ